MKPALIALLIPLMTEILLAAPEKGSDHVQSRSHERRGNAALQYWKAWEIIMSYKLSDSERVEYQRILLAGHKAPLDDAAIKAIHFSGQPLYYLHRGARMDHCDWGIAFDEAGARDEQGHLAQTPKLVGAACLRARYYFEKGKPHAAIDDLVAALRLAGHAGNNGQGVARALMTQVAAEHKVIEVTARYLPQLDAASTDRLGRQMTLLPVQKMLKNFLQTQKKLWADWPAKYARNVSKQGNRDAYWWDIHLRDTLDGAGTEDGKTLKDLAGGSPERLLKLAHDAAVFYDQAIKIADLPEKKFRPAFRALHKKVAGQNPLVDLIGGVAGHIHNNLVLANLRRALLRAGIAVVRDGSQKLKDFKDPYGDGPFEYRELKDGFELTSKLKFSGEPLKLVFGQP